jgi:hypothetical protein
LTALGAVGVTAGTLVTAASLAAAARARGVQALALLAMAGFVWLRPGVKPAGRPSPLYVIGFAALVAAMWWLARHAAVRSGIGSLLGEISRRQLAAMVAVLCLLLMPVIWLPIIGNWDVSGWMDSQSYDTFAMNIVTGKAPHGSSGYMPLYQYGLALVYFIAGHFFFSQQIVNALFATAGLIALSLAAWQLYGRAGAAVLAAAVLYIYTRQLFFAVHFTQIEAWYVPLVCLVLLAWARYWTGPTTRRAAWLAAAIGAGLSTRNQGAFFFAVMCLAPLAAAGVAAKQRVRHLLVIAALVAAILTPWTIRNAVVDGRWSPVADRSAMYMGILTDSRVGLYGVRYWEGWDEVARDYQARYPDLAERERAYLDGAWNNVVSNPGWLARAVAWRSAAFYGVLPDGLIELDAIRPTDWRAEWARYVFSRTTPLVLLPLSLLAVIARPNRTTAFLVAAIAGSLAIVIASASPEDRISYPVWPIHILLAAGLFAGAAPLRPPVATAPSQARRRVLMPAVAAIAVLLIATRTFAGAPNTYRALMAPTTVAAELAIDGSLPLLNASYGGDPLPIAAGQRARARVMLSNYMYPPKFVGAVAFVPPFATAAGSPQYYFAYLIADGAAPAPGPAVGVLLDGALASERLREGDAADVEGVVQFASPHTVTGYWMRVEKIHKLPVPREQLPVFP